VGDALVADHRLCMIADQLQPFSQSRVVGHTDATFPGVDVFVVVETVDADVCDGAGIAAPVAGCRRLGAVFDNLEVVLTRDGHDRVHLGSVPKDVRYHDRTGAGGDV